MGAVCLIDIRYVTLPVGYPPEKNRNSLSVMGTYRASRAGLEWFWRLLHEPRTVWRRALVYGPQFMFLSMLDLIRHRTKPRD